MQNIGTALPTWMTGQVTGADGSSLDPSDFRFLTENSILAVALFRQRAQSVTRL